MKYVKFLVVGIFFGIIMTKSEAVSWFRIQEMFRFQSFHMYGIIGSALGLGVIIIQLIKRSALKTYKGVLIHIEDKAPGYKRYLFGGIIFGFGWALTGACPGPMYTLLGYGYSIFIVVLFSALLGTYTYGRLKNKLPH